MELKVRLISFLRQLRQVGRVYPLSFPYEKRVEHTCLSCLTCLKIKRTFYSKEQEMNKITKNIRYSE